MVAELRRGGDGESASWMREDPVSMTDYWLDWKAVCALEGQKMKWWRKLRPRLAIRSFERLQGASKKGKLRHSNPNITIMEEGSPHYVYSFLLAGVMYDALVSIQNKVCGIC